MQYFIKCKCRNCKSTFEVATFEALFDTVKEAYTEKYAYDHQTLIHKCQKIDESIIEYGLADIIAFYQKED